MFTNRENKLLFQMKNDLQRYKEQNIVYSVWTSSLLASDDVQIRRFLADKSLYQSKSRISPGNTPGARLNT